MPYLQYNNCIFFEIKKGAILSNTKSPVAETRVGNRLCKFERVFLENIKTEFFMDPLLSGTIQLSKLPKS